MVRPIIDGVEHALGLGFVCELFARRFPESQFVSGLAVVRVGEFDYPPMR